MFIHDFFLSFFVLFLFLGSSSLLTFLVVVVVVHDFLPYVVGFRPSPFRVNVWCHRPLQYYLAI